jgi:hypothetical protein
MGSAKPVGTPCPSAGNNEEAAMMMNRSNEALLQFDEKQEARVHLEITWEALRILESTGLFDIQDCYVALGIVTTEEPFALARDRVVQRLSSTLLPPPPRR